MKNESIYQFTVTDEETQIDLKNPTKTRTIQAIISMIKYVYLSKDKKFINSAFSTAFINLLSGLFDVMGTDFDIEEYAEKMNFVIYAVYNIIKQKHEKESKNENSMLA